MNFFHHCPATVPNSTFDCPGIDSKSPWYGKKEATLWLFWQILRLQHDSGLMGNDYFCITFKIIKLMMMWHLLGSVPNKHVFLHLENKIYRPGRLCSATILHSNSVLWHILALLKKLRLLQFGWCSRPYCDFDNIPINSAALLYKDCPTLKLFF